jgi:hypothetical protein
MRSPDLPIFLDPPEVLTALVPRQQLREALRLAKKFGPSDEESAAYLYSAEGKLFVEAGRYRQGFPHKGDWSGCISLKASLLLTYWNSLPKGDEVTLKYERGWLSIGTLALGRAVWQPKYDPQWMELE